MKRHKIWVSVSIPMDLFREVFDYSSIVSIHECLVLNKAYSLLAKQYLKNRLTKFYQDLPELCFGVRKNLDGKRSECCMRKNYACAAHKFLPIIEEHDFIHEKFSNKEKWDYCEKTKALKRPTKHFTTVPIYSTIFADRIIGVRDHDFYTTKNPRWLQKVKPIKWTTRSTCFTIFKKKLYPEMKNQVSSYLKKGYGGKLHNRIRRWFCHHGEDELYLHILRDIEMGF